MGRLKPLQSVALHQRPAVERVRRPQQVLHPRRQPLLEPLPVLPPDQLLAHPLERLPDQQRVLRSVLHPAR